MIPFIGPDIEQALKHTFFLTALHNGYPIVLFIGILVSIAYALYRPSRKIVLLFVGLLLLLLHFEYVKHIVDPLLQQTQVTLTTETPRWKFIWLTEKMITRGMPLFLLSGGLLTTFSACFLAMREKKK